MRYILLLLSLAVFGCFAPEKQGNECIDEKNCTSIGVITNVQFTSPAYSNYKYDNGKTIITAKKATVVLNSIRPVPVGIEAFMTTDCLGGSWFNSLGSNTFYLVYDKSN